jgi:hypothetical protein
MKGPPLLLDGTPPTPMRSKWRRFVDRHLPSIVLYLMVATLLAIVLYLGSANARAPPAPATSATDNDTILKEKAAAARPDLPLEKAPAAGRM